MSEISPRRVVLPKLVNRSVSQGVLGVSKRILGFTWDGGGTDIRGIILIFFVVYYWFTLFGQVIFIRKYSVLGVNKKK